VVVVRPGFVRTRMTAHLKPAPFSTTPDKVADAVATAIDRGSRIVWVPGILRWVMMVLRHLPETLFRRLPG
jgi:decaprenylphospho-beta-D-erythro-pentofuranosid-2-ulose 2-reductase